TEKAEADDLEGVLSVTFRTVRQLQAEASVQALTQRRCSASDTPSFLSVSITQRGPFPRARSSRAVRSEIPARAAHSRNGSTISPSSPSSGMARLRGAISTG